MIKSKMHKKSIIWLCIFLLLFTLQPAYAASAPAESSNKNAQNYSTWSKTVKSYLYENESGGLTRVEYIGGKVIAEDYDDMFNVVKSREISPELPMWGGFFAGNDANYLIYGQSNKDQNDNAEVLRVVKYSKDWNRISAASLRGANTTVPFDAGSLRCAEADGTLCIRTSHEMYASSDGLNHQANLTLFIRESDMTITTSHHSVSNRSTGYVSHSFNQFIIADSDGNMVAVDHGDAYPRSLYLSRYKGTSMSGSSTIQEIPGAVGNNTTGLSAGGLAEVKDGYITAYNFNGTGNSGGDRLLYLAYTDKHSLNSTSKAVFNGGCMTPVLVSAGLDGGWLLWNSTENSDQQKFYYTEYDGHGGIGAVKSAEAVLSDCQPILYNGKVVWYATNATYGHGGNYYSSNSPVFYILDESGVTAMPTVSPFSDVSNNSWYASYVRFCYSAELINGTSADTFSPDKSITLAETVTLAARAHAMQNGNTINSSGTPWYKGAYDYCISNGIISSSDYSLSSMTREASRFEVVDIMDGAVSDENMTPVVQVPNGAISDLRETDKYGETVYRWYRAGILSGNDDGTFGGSRSIKRSEIAKILYGIY